MENHEKDMGPKPLMLMMLPWFWASGGCKAQAVLGVSTCTSSWDWFRGFRVLGC